MNIQSPIDHQSLLQLSLCIHESENIEENCQHFFQHLEQEFDFNYASIWKIEQILGEFTFSMVFESKSDVIETKNIPLDSSHLLTFQQLDTEVLNIGTYVIPSIFQNTMAYWLNMKTWLTQ